MTPAILKFPRPVIRIVRSEHWSVRAPGINEHLFACVLDARRFARRIARHLNLAIREYDR